VDVLFRDETIKAENAEYQWKRKISADSNRYCTRVCAISGTVVPTVGQVTCTA